MAGRGQIWGPSPGFAEKLRSKLEVLADMPPYKLEDMLILRRDGRLFYVNDIRVEPGSGPQTRTFLQHFYSLVQMRSRNKVSVLYNFLDKVKSLEWCKDDFEEKFYEVFLDVLVEEQCEDSELVTEIAELCGRNLSLWLLKGRNERRLDYVLRHTQKKNFDIFNEVYSDGCPVGISISHGAAWNIQALLKYGCPTDFAFETENSYAIRGAYLSPDKRQYVKVSPRNSKSKLRRALLIQLLNIYVYNNDPPAITECVRMLWRSIPVPFLDKEDVTGLFPLTSVHGQAFLRDAWAFYKGILRAERDFRPRESRCLAHLCRCRIRSALGRNLALPEGADELGLPVESVSYLKLEH